MTNLRETTYNVIREVAFKLPMLDTKIHNAYFIAPSNATKKETRNN